MKYIAVEDWDEGDAQEALSEAKIHTESIGSTLDQEIKIETFLENIDSFSQAQFDEFIKQCRAK
jgi:hypothetical protein